MRKRTFVVGVLVAAVLIGGGVLLASNMGFKLNYALQNSVAAGGGNGSNTLALPFNRQVGLNTSKQLMDDIGSASVASVQRYVRSSNAFEAYTGRTGTPSPDFALSDGEGYIVRMSTTTNYIVVGSHNPTLPVGLQNATSAGGGNGSNFFGFNYHHTSTTSKQLMDDVGSASVASVQRYIKSSNAFEVYTGRTGTPNPNFNLAIGEAYIVRMSTSTSYVPSHY